MNDLWNRLDVWLMIPYEAYTPFETSLLMNWYFYNVEFKKENMR